MLIKQGAQQNFPAVFSCKMNITRIQRRDFLDTVCRLSKIKKRERLKKSLNLCLQNAQIFTKKL